MMGIGEGGGARAPKPKNRVDVHYFSFWRLLVELPFALKKAFFGLFGLKQA